MNKVNVNYEGIRYEVVIDETVATIYIPSQSDLDDSEIKEIEDEFRGYAKRWFKDVITINIDRTLPNTDYTEEEEKEIFENIVKEWEEEDENM